MKKKILFVVIIILLALVTFVGGTAYWLFSKAKSISKSAMNVAGVSTAAPEEDLKATFSMPASDSAGRDLENVPRYAGAIRTNYYVSLDKDFTSVEYVAPTSAETLNEYYKNYLQPLNWTLVSRDQKTTNYTSEGYDLTIEIILKNTSPQLVKYSLNLTKVSF